jgi:TPR repeat protein
MHDLTTDQLIFEADLDSYEAQLRLVYHYTADEFDYDKAEKWLIRLQSKGSLYGLYELARLYLDGRDAEIGCVSTNLHAYAKRLLFDSESKGHIQAIYDVAWEHLGDSAAYDSGIKKMQLAAKLGQRHAQQLISKYPTGLPNALVLSANGDFDNDFEFEEKWEIREHYLNLELGKIGNTIRQSMVGDFFYKRELFEDAFKWFKIASDNGNKIARFNLGLMHAKNLTKDCTTTCCKEIFNSLAFEGDAGAMHELGVIFLAEENMSEALAMFWLASRFSENSDKYYDELDAARTVMLRLNDEVIAQAQNKFSEYKLSSDISDSRFNDKYKIE